MKSSMVYWSSLPSDLVRCVGDCLLATNDIDYYMDMRAVCSNWRTAMADPCRPGADADHLLFRPRRWIMLDEESESEHRLFVNVSTGRFLSRCLPLLRDYVVVSASDGLVILGESKHPYAACVLNPFTGSLTRFALPVLPENIVMNVVTGSEPVPVLYALKVGHDILWCVHPTSKFLSVQLSHPGQYKVQSMVAYAGHIYVACMAGSLFKIVGTAQHCYGELIAKIPSKDDIFLVESSGDLLLIRRSHWGFFGIFRVDVERNTLETINSIGSRALFLGPRSLSVDADKLPSINGDCLYYEGQTGTYMYDLKDGTESTIWSIMMPQRFIVHPKSLVEVLLLYCLLGPNLKYLMKLFLERTS